MLKRIDSKSAELIGAHVGDGTLYKTNRGVVWELRGRIDEKEYYQKNIKYLLESIFNLDFNPKFRSGGKNGCFGIQTSKKKVTSFFLACNFEPGRKTHNVVIPDCIKKNSKKIKRSFIRGLFDTDGCLRFDKNHGKIRKYPKLEISSASKQLIEDLSAILKELGFIRHTWKDRQFAKICIPGLKMLNQWFEEIEPRNPKHLNKYNRFQEQGYI